MSNNLEDMVTQIEQQINEQKDAQRKARNKRKAAARKIRDAEKQKRKWQ